jgi:hypothetical protein
LATGDWHRLHTRGTLAFFWNRLEKSGKVALSSGSVPLAETLFADFQLDMENEDYRKMRATRDQLFEQLMEELSTQELLPKSWIFH